MPNAEDMQSEDTQEKHQQDDWAPGKLDEQACGKHIWHEGVKMHQQELDVLKIHEQHMAAALTLLKRLKKGGMPPLTEQLYLRKVKEFELDDEHFFPGAPSLCLKAWRMLGECLGPGDEEFELVEKFLSNGYDVVFADPNSQEQKDRPEWEKKRNVLLRMLAKVMSVEEAEQLLNAATPARIHLPNFKSAVDNEHVVDAEVEKLLKRGTIQEWNYSWGEPHVVNPMGVVSKGDKHRLVAGLNFLNWFEKHEGFKYQTLASITDFVEPGFWMFTHDAKSGYHHIPVGPKCWKYMAFFWKGKMYYFRYLPFGLSSACRTYTMFMSVVNRVTRMYGELNYQYIDDGMAVASTQSIAAWYSLSRRMLGAALGIFFGSGKSVWWPTQKVGLLGMTICTAKKVAECPKKVFVSFEVSAAKLERIVQEAKKLREAAEPTKRDLASLAGKIMACKLAITVAPLLVRPLFLLMKDYEGWDGPRTSSAELKAELLWVVENLEKRNGNCVMKPLRAAGLKIVVDTSVSTHAAIVSDLETGEVLQELTTVISKHLVGQSSGLREVTGVEWLTKCAYFEQAKTFLHKKVRFLLVNDNKGMVGNLLNMKAGSKELFTPVRGLHDFAWEHDVELSVEWAPRETDEVVAVDGLGKESDHSDFEVSADCFEKVTNTKLPPDLQTMLGREVWGKPDVDTLASVQNSKAERFFSRGYDKGSSGVDAFAQHWPAREDGKRTLYWVFPGPFASDLAAKAIKKIREECCDAILLLPHRTKHHWSSMLLGLPIAAVQRRPYVKGNPACSPGLTAPEKHQNVENGVPLTAYLVVW